MEGMPGRAVPVERELEWASDAWIEAGGSRNEEAAENDDPVPII